MINWILFAIVVILQVLDSCSTIKALSKPGIREANPALAWLMGKIGIVLALVLIKGLLVVIIAAAIYWYPSGSLTTALAGIVVVYVAVVINNFRKA